MRFILFIHYIFLYMYINKLNLSIYCLKRIVFNVNYYITYLNKYSLQHNQYKSRV